MNGSDNTYAHRCRLCNVLIGNFESYDNSAKARQKFCGDCLVTGADRLHDLIEESKKIQERFTTKFRIKFHPSSFFGRFFLHLAKFCG